MNAARKLLSFSVEQAVYDGLERAALAMNTTAADYGRRLFSAAYAARVARQKNMPATDAELDVAVRAVFVLSGEFKPREIAQALKLSENVVDNIFRGFRQVAGEARDAESGKGEALAEPSRDGRGPAKGEEPALRTTSAFTADDHAALRRLYATDLSVRGIAERLRCTRGSLEQFIAKNRSEFPYRGQK